MKILLFVAVIAAALGTAASACPTRDAKIRGDIPKRDVRASTSASMTVRWNSQPASAPVAKAAKMRMMPALPPLRAVI